MKHLVASLLILAIACRLEAATRIENNRYAVNVEAADGTFTIATKPDGKMVLPAGKLSGTAGKAKTVLLDDKKFGQGQGIEIIYPDGNQEVVALYPNLPFVTFRSTFRNAGNELLVLNHVPTVSAAVDLGKPLSGISTLGTGGLLEPDKNPGSYAFLSMADPQTRAGVVGGWLTHDRGSGVVFSPVKDGTARIQAQIDYGRLRIKPGAEAVGEWFALGYFDDARFGLEAYADAVGKIYDVKLLPQTSGLCTWYMDRHAAACDEVHLKELTAASAKELKPFGFEYIQIDDDWQDGVKENGPKKNFTIHAPKGPYPGGMKATADMIESFGLVPGIWFMPFAGNYKDPFFKDRQNLFVKNDKGQPYETSWGGTCLDMTLPETQEFVSSIVHRIAHDWGYKFFKMDGFWTGSGTPQMYVNDAYKRDGIGDAVFANPDKTNIEALRDGAKLVREAAGPDVFLLGCCVVQNMRSFGGSFGLLDAMRVGPDTNDGSIGSLHASPVWFLHGRVWWNDPDFVSVRAGHSLDRARLNAGWTAISGQLFYISDWLPAYPADRLDIIKRCLPAHGLPSRPVDVFESRIARIWHIADTRQPARRDVVAYYNWDKDRAEISATPEHIGLPPAKEYVGFDFWANKFIPPFTGHLTASLPGNSSRIMAIRPVSENPQLLSTSRHVTQGMVDVTGENWDTEKSELSATSKLVGNDRYEIRIVVPSSEKSWRATGIKISPEDEAAGVKADIKQDGPRLRANLSSATSREVKWTVAFERGAAVDVLPPPVAGLKAHVEYNTISLSWTDSGAAAYRVSRSDGETVTEPLAMFIDTKFPREKPLTYKVEALAGDGQAAAPALIEVTPLTVMTAPPVPPLPTVSLDANNTKFVENTAGQARFGLSYTGKPLRIDGKTYSNGYGTHANAVAVATIPQGATRFVATVGIDDAGRVGGEATVLFEVYGDVKEMGEKPVLLGQSPVLNTKELASWNFNVELNTRFKEVRLVVKDGGDKVHSDHADWVNAGFIVPAEPKPEALVPLDHVPQIHETKEQYEKRTQWFRDAKFGLFIHWGPCSLGQKEIGWGARRTGLGISTSTDRGWTIPFMTTTTRGSIRRNSIPPPGRA